MDAELCGRFLDSIKLSAYNTRLLKLAPKHYRVLLASAIREASRPSQQASGDWLP